MIAFKKIIKCTNAVRNAIRIDRSFLWKKKSVRLLTNRYTNYAGRNNTGRVVSRTHGTRVRKRVRIIDHGRCVYNVPCIVARVEYDPNRSSFISLAIFANGVCTYMLSSSNAAVGHIFTSYASDIVAFENYYTGLSTSFNIGDSSKLEYMPRGTVLFDVERSPYLWGSVARSGGTSCVLLKKYVNLRKCLLLIPSKSMLSFSYYCGGTKGVASNALHNRTSYGNAGIIRRLGFKSVVRGVAQNPVDHAHGGGEGKKSKSCFPRTAWGKMLHWRETGIHYVNITFNKHES